MYIFTKIKGDFPIGFAPKFQGQTSFFFMENGLVNESSNKDH